MFALGWGGGHLLGAFSSTDSAPPSPQPQLVDADAYSSSKKENESDPKEEKSSSLLEQVFGLDDLEEEKPAKPARKVDSREVSGVETEQRGDADNQNGDLADQILRGTEPPVQEVELEDRPPAAEPAAPEKDPTDGELAPTEESAPPEQKPQKDILSDNPYK